MYTRAALYILCIWSWLLCQEVLHFQISFEGTITQLRTKLVLISDWIFKCFVLWDRACGFCKQHINRLQNALIYIYLYTPLLLLSIQEDLSDLVKRLIDIDILHELVAIFDTCCIPVMIWYSLYITSMCLQHKKHENAIFVKRNMT